jgi:hypothetical protein
MKRAAPAVVFIAFVVWLVVQPRGLAQQSPLGTGTGASSETRNSALRLASDSADSLRQLNTLVEQRFREGTLAPRVRL